METLQEVVKKIQNIKPELELKYHVSRIGVFGSVVRQDFTENSDIDIVVDFSEPIGIEFVDLADELELNLERKVDLVSLSGIKPGYFHEIEAEIEYV